VTAPPPASTARLTETANGTHREVLSAPIQAEPFAAETQPAEDTPALEPEAAPSSVASPQVETLRQAVVAGLAAAGHSTAGQLLGSGAWTIDGSNLRIEVPGMGKKMLSLTVNAAAEKIIRQELQRLGGPARFLVVPGAAGAAAAAEAAAPAAGSIQEEALANPLVQRAREIFKAEVRSVVDLRQK